MFGDVVMKGRAFHSPLFLVRVLADKTQLMPRVAAAAPVKVFKTSVLRHRVRRRIYGAMQPLIEKIVPGHIIVVLAKAAVVEASSSELKAAISEIFVKAGVLR